jgi:1-acyl-sn-glycerol-3-phosphate acyltransferase
MKLPSAVRSFLAVVACLFLLGVLAPLTLYLVVVPLLAIGPGRRVELGSRWVTWVAKSLTSLIRMGGAKIEIEGTIDCAQAGVVIMNHQSVLEIPALIHILRPRLPRFVARSRYARSVPTVSRAIEYLDCIVIDPRRDRAGAVIAIKKAAEEGLHHMVMLFPEGHRTRDGEVAAFRPAGMIALLEGRQLPVFTIACDGFWRLRTVMDSFFGLGSVRGRLKVVDRAISPVKREDLEPFIEERRQIMIRELARMRAEASR